jgi:hypothetical protein
LWVGRVRISPSGAKKAIQSSFPPPGGEGKPFSVQRPQSGFRPRSAQIAATASFKGPLRSL